MIYTSVFYILHTDNCANITNIQKEYEIWYTSRLNYGKMRER